MKFDIGGRQVGKTKRMLDWAEAAPEGEHRVIVSATEHQAMDLLRRSRKEERKLESWQFVGVQELKGNQIFSGVIMGRGGQIVLGIDNLDLIVGNWFQFRVGRVSATDGT